MGIFSRVLRKAVPTNFDDFNETKMKFISICKRFVKTKKLPISEGKITKNGDDGISRFLGIDSCF